MLFQDVNKFFRIIVRNLADISEGWLGLKEILEYRDDELAGNSVEYYFIK